MNSPRAPLHTDGASPENLAGLVERITFHNPDNGFCVLRLKARGQRDLVTVIGHAALISAGEFVQATGTWLNDREHGLQFRASFLKASPPTTLEGIEKYLGSGMIRGIGPAYAKRLTQAFAEAVFDVIEQEPRRLRDIEGIGPKRAERIVAGWAEQKVVREIMLFLHAHGVGTSRSVRIFKTYGAEAVAIISENPYRLARDIRGIGFKTADQIAAKVGIAMDALIRIRAGVSYALAEAMDDGHCGLPEEQLIKLTAELIEVPHDRIEAALALELQDGAVIADTVEDLRCIFLAGLYRAEQAIAERLRALTNGPPPWPKIDVDKAIPWLETRNSITLADSQRQALHLALSSKVLVITRRSRGRQDDAGQLDPEGAYGEGGEGRPVRADGPRRQATDGEHRRRGQDHPSPSGNRSQKRRLSQGRDQPARLRTARRRRDQHGGRAADASVAAGAPDRSALLLVGDIDQLPSVGPGQVLSDVIESGAVPVVRLTEVFRQAATSRVIVNAHRINRGEMPASDQVHGEKSDFYIVDAPDPEQALAKVLAVVRHRIPKAFGLDPIRDVQVLCPMNRGGVGARSLNIELQKVLNPPGDTKVERFGWTYAPGDKVMQVENNYDREVYNGDLGLVARLDMEAGELVATFDGREVVYGFGELDELVLAYATTIHKSQGSEYPAVVIPVMTQHYTMLARNLLYTGVTRGKKLVVLVGQSRAIAIAVKNGGRRRRWAKLREWLAMKGTTGGSRQDELSQLYDGYQ